MWRIILCYFLVAVEYSPQCMSSGGPEELNVEVDDCVWNKDTDFGIYPSLLMDPVAWKSILPVENDGIREVRITGGGTVVIACPESTITALNNIEVTEGVCESGNMLNVGGTRYTMQELSCVSRVRESLQKDIGICAEGQGMEQAIGFEVTGYDFYELVRVCFDPLKEIALYSKHLLRGESVSGSDQNPSRPSFKSSSGYYSVSPNNCYAISSQETLTLQLLGSEDVIDQSENLYFARGHLAPDADFHTEMEADATYYYINAVPQWQSFNGGNWKSLETDVRNLGETHGSDLQIWTGTWNILELSDQNNNPVQIFLGLTDDEEVIPAPDITWKVIYDPASDLGVAVVGSNNPYLDSLPDRLCNDICNQITWLDVNFDDIKSGATYCCTVQDLHSVVPFSPDLPSAGVLTQ